MRLRTPIRLLLLVVLQLQVRNLQEQIILTVHRQKMLKLLIQQQWVMVLMHLV